MKDMDNKYIVWGLVTVAVVAFIIWQVGFGSRVKTEVSPSSQNNETNQPASGVGTQNIIGSVGEVNGQIITLKTTSPGTSGAVSNSTKKVEVTGSTVIEKIVLKDQATLQKEFAAFSAETKDKGSKVAPPIPFNRVKVSVGDLKVGDNLVVTASLNAGADGSFQATTIIVQPVAPNK